MINILFPFSAKKAKETKRKSSNSSSTGSSISTAELRRIIEKLKKQQKPSDDQQELLHNLETIQQFYLEVRHQTQMSGGKVDIVCGILSRY